MNRRKFITLSCAASASSVYASSPKNSEDKPLVSFGLLTDVQYADLPPEGERHYRTSIAKLKTAVADLAKESLPFTMHLGDFIDRDFKSFAAVLPLLEPLCHPTRHLIGNHDCSVAEEMKNRIPATLGMPNDYYAFRSSGVNFIMLDTNEVSSYKYADGSEEDRKSEAALKKLRQTKTDDKRALHDGISTTQLEWLEKQLTAADSANEPAIVCSHHPLVPTSNDQTPIPAAFRQHPCVRACFSGHNHAGAEAIIQGLPFITFKSILNEPDITAYAVVRLFKERLVIEGRGREKSRVIQLRE